MVFVIPFVTSRPAWDVPREAGEDQCGSLAILSSYHTYSFVHDLQRRFIDVFRFESNPITSPAWLPALECHGIWSTAAAAPTVLQPIKH